MLTKIKKGSKRNPNRKYDEKGRRERIECDPPIRCMIIDAVRQQAVGYDSQRKTIVTGTTIFESKQRARRALWHICQAMPKATHKGFDRYKIVPTREGG